MARDLSLSRSVCSVLIVSKQVVLERREKQRAALEAALDAVQRRFRAFAARRRYLLYKIFIGVSARRIQRAYRRRLTAFDRAIRLLQRCLRPPEARRCRWRRPSSRRGLAWSAHRATFLLLAFPGRRHGCS